MIRARVKFWDSSEGGRLTPPQSGYHPQLAIDGIQTSVIIDAPLGIATFDFNHEYECVLRPLFPGSLRRLLAGEELILCEGSKSVGIAVVVTDDRIAENVSWLGKTNRSGHGLP